jgi:hypothetical protein
VVGVEKEDARMTIEEAREVLRSGQAVLEQNLTATQGQYHDAIDALRVALAVVDLQTAAQAQVEADRARRQGFEPRIGMVRG